MPHKARKHVSPDMSKCRKCKSDNILLVEYGPDDPEHYDGISEIQCQDCGARIGRWSHKELKEGECEKRYGGFNPLFAKAQALSKRHRRRIKP